MKHSNSLKEAVQSFKKKKEKTNEHIQQIATLQLLCNFDILNKKTLSQESYTNIMQRVEKALRAERIKALQKHWSYDLNRHIALKKIRDQLRKEKDTTSDQDPFFLRD